MSFSVEELTDMIWTLGEYIEYSMPATKVHRRRYTANKQSAKEACAR